MKYRSFSRKFYADPAPPRRIRAKRKDNGSKMTSSDKWWNHIQIPETGSTSVSMSNWAKFGMVKAALEGGPSLITRSASGNRTKPIKEILGSITSFGLYKILEDPPDRSDESQSYEFAWPRGGLYISFDEDEECHWTYVTSDSEKDLTLHKYLNEVVVPLASGGKIFSLRNTQDGLDVVSMGKISSDLVRANYSDEVLLDVDHVVEDLKSRDPCGRLIVFNGPPGTGKTFLIKGLLHSIPDALFITVNPNIVPKFSNPEFTSLLIELRSRNEKGKHSPIIFLIEDADEVLVPRGSDNMDGISNCLNLTDGLMGHLFDLRIIATTNAKNASMDVALLRPGRICKNIEVGKLSITKSAEIFKRLTGKELTSEAKGHTLAEIYSKARGNGWTPPKVNGVLGFKSEKNEDVRKLLGI